TSSGSSTICCPVGEKKPRITRMNTDKKFFELLLSVFIREIRGSTVCTLPSREQPAYNGVSQEAIDPLHGSFARRLDRSSGARRAGERGAAEPAVPWRRSARGAARLGGDCRRSSRRQTYAKTRPHHP